jgi:hypothetical protein
VLLASLKSHTKSTLTTRILGNTDNASGHEALELVLAGEEGGVRTTVTHRDTEALSRTDDDIGTEFTRSLQQGERKQVRADDHETAGLVGRLRELLVIDDATVGGGVLDEHSGQTLQGLSVQLGNITNLHLPAQGLSTGLHMDDGNEIADERAEKNEFGRTFRRAML